MEREDKLGVNEPSAEQSGPRPRSGGWEQVERTSAFAELVKAKKAFIVPAMLFFFVFFTAWTALGGLTTVLDGRAFGAVTWATVFGFAQFVVVLVLLHLYTARAKKWDRLVEEARREAPERRRIS
ncbi:DUF485 domain-containing protein [Rubrobacter marinus]|uniref:DUF485 domain-containing protein n=1 Tax=Rubrobacter marinus TaxID=2653852 RepID=UPI00140D89D9|nr:DUF485 domain-containing protein [Rubrobacter marinus]